MQRKIAKFCAGAILLLTTGLPFNAWADADLPQPPEEEDSDPDEDVNFALLDLPGEKQFFSDLDRAHLMYLPRLETSQFILPPVSMRMQARTQSATPTPPSIPQDVSALQKWLDCQTIAGVVANATQSRMILSGQLHTVGDTVNTALQIRWTGIEPHSRTLYFKNSEDKLLARRY